MIKKFKLLLIFISISVTLCLMSNTYSRYVAGATGNIDVMFAKWQILVNTIDITNNNTSKIEFEPTIEQNNNVKKDKIAPTSKGYVDIDIDPTNVDVSFKYNINLEIENINIPDLIITKYAIIDDTYVEGQELTYISLTDNKISNQLNFDNTESDFTFDKFTVRVFFEWYDGEVEKMNDSADTLATKENTTFKINASINFEQAI